MGANNQPQKASGKTIKSESKVNIYEDEYRKSYQNLKVIPNFFIFLKLTKDKFINECPRFGTNLQKLFPKAFQSFDQYLQMVMYLRKYDAQIKINKQAGANIKKSTLLDRFFMICLGNLSFQQYQYFTATKQQIELLLLDYYKLFIQNPKVGTIDKVLKYMSFEKDLQKLSVREFSEKFRQYFPHVQKFLKDYYYSKFHQMKQKCLLMSQIKSKILNEDAIILALKLAQIAKPQVTQLYNSDDMGSGFHSIEKKLVGYTGPWLLLVEHTQKNFQGQRQNYVFGTYQNGPVKDVSQYQGDLTSFMFSIDPNIRFMTTDKGQGGANYFVINNVDEKVSKRRKGFGFGGTAQKQNFKLWLDADIDKSKVFNGNDITYGYGPLAGPGTLNLNIKIIQIWGLGTKQNLIEQQEYWAERNEEIMKRRKVDKKQFFDQNSGIFFEKTFAHRNQVVGEIQKRQEKPENDKQA